MGIFFFLIEIVLLKFGEWRFLIFIVVGFLMWIGFLCIVGKCEVIWVVCIMFCWGIGCILIIVELWNIFVLVYEIFVLYIGIL